jgi:hypothetical protein
MQDRYEVRPLGPVFVIRDMQMRGFCSLNGKDVLEWAERWMADQWLTTCYGYWGSNPAVGENPPPKAAWLTRKYVERQSGSPWATWTTPIEDSRFGR